MNTTQYLIDATRQKLFFPAGGFNAAFSGVASTYGVQPISIDWNPVTSVQYFEANLEPDDLDESSPAKYPMVFLHGVNSSNSHDSKGSKFFGPVELGLTFWLTHKASSAAKAGRGLEKLVSAVEDVVHGLFYDGNWPQSFGASGAICLSPFARRGPVQMAGEEFRQSITFRMAFTLDTN